jgi:hypothetical protein
LEENSPKCPYPAHDFLALSIGMFLVIGSIFYDHETYLHCYIISLVYSFFGFIICKRKKKTKKKQKISMGMNHVLNMVAAYVSLEHSTKS